MTKGKCARAHVLFARAHALFTSARVLSVRAYYCSELFGPWFGSCKSSNSKIEK